MAAGAFPQFHENFLIFALKGTYRQFISLLRIRWLARVGLIVFLFGLFKLWRDKSPLHSTIRLAILRGMSGRNISPVPIR